MIPFLSNYLSKSKTAWLARQDAKLRTEFAPQLTVLSETLRQQEQALQGRLQELHRLQATIEDQAQLLSDRQVAVAKANEECRTQLRLLEAKAAPDAVWVEAFSRGFEKAWEAMWPLLAENVYKSKQAIEQIAIDATLARLDQTVATRAEQLGQVQVREKLLLLAKQQEFLAKRNATKSPVDKERYEHYLTALDWMLDANGLHSNQPVTQ